MQPISDRTPSALREIFLRDKVLIGMIRCPPLPEPPRYRGTPMAGVCDACLRDAGCLIATA